MKFKQLIETSKQQQIKDFNKKWNNPKDFDPIKWFQGIDQQEKDFTLPKNQKMRSAKIKSRTAKFRNEIKKLDNDVKKMYADIKKREAKVYGKNTNTVQTRDEFNQSSGSISIGRLNELKRRKAIRRIRYDIAMAEEKILQLYGNIVNVMQEIDYKFDTNPYLKDFYRIYHLSEIDYKKRMEKISRNKIPYEKWVRTKG